MNQTQTESLQKIQINLESPGFEELIIEAIDQTFTNLGLKVKQAFYCFLATHYRLGEEDIPNRISSFVDALEKIFGASASIIEINVLKNLQQKVPSFTYVVRSSDLTLESYLASLKGYLEKVN